MIPLRRKTETAEQRESKMVEEFNELTQHHEYTPEQLERAYQLIEILGY